MLFQDVLLFHFSNVISKNQSVGVELKSFQTDVFKPGQIQTNPFAWLDITTDEQEDV